MFEIASYIKDNLNGKRRYWIVRKKKLSLADELHESGIYFYILSRVLQFRREAPVNA